jgi:hypothetical protein
MNFQSTKDKEMENNNVINNVINAVINNVIKFYTSARRKQEVYQKGSGYYIYQKEVVCGIRFL